MSLFVFSNNVQTQLAAPISSTTTTIPLTSSANFPAIPAGYVWAVTLNDQATGLVYEIAYVTATSGANLTVLRGQEGTTAQSWLANDKAFAAVTASALNNFVENPTLSGFVQLQPGPGSPQTGAICVSQSITAIGYIASASYGSFAALSVYGGGVFTGSLTGQNGVISSLPYGSRPIAGLSFICQASATVGIGPSTGLTVQGITASMLAIGHAGSGAFVAIDSSGNVATAGSFLGQNGLFLGEVAGTSVYNNGTQCLTTLSTVTLLLNRTSPTNYQVDLSPQVYIGMSMLNDGNGGSPNITLPNYGAEWFIEVFYGLQQTSNTSNMQIVLALSGGTITGGFLSNANHVASFNAVAWIALYGKGRTTINNQTIAFSLSVIGGGSLDPLNQPWTVRATRTA